MEFSGFFLGACVGALVGFAVVGGGCFLLYLKAMRKIQTLQATLLAEATDFASDKGMSAGKALASRWLSPSSKNAS